MKGKSARHTLLTDYLDALGVPHTFDYSTSRLNSMPFKTLFGFSKLLEEYGVDSEGYKLSNKQEITKITPPFIANTVVGEVIVTDLNADTISYISEGVPVSADLQEFLSAFDGNVLLSFPKKDATEPDYRMHARIEFFMRAKKWVLALCACFLLIYLFTVNHLYAHLSAWFIAAIDIAGIYFTYLLVQKSVDIHNPAADKVCSVLQAGGCDSILELKASKFYGIFGWSEVGFAYFSVSLATLLLFPEMLPQLALCNICCLPFTVWSIWYQKFRAHKWCTLCVCVQCSLWLLFFSYLFGGWINLHEAINWNFIALGATYVGVMLAINAIMPLIEKNSTATKPQENEEN